MTGFAVDLPVLRQGATDMYTLANRVTWAKYHAQAYLSSSIEGGTWFFDAGAEVNDLGETLAQTYSHSEVRSLFDNASIALQQMVRDYRSVDAEARRAADGLADDLGPVDPAKDLASALNGREPSVGSPSYADAFDDPENAFDQWDTFVGIGRDITYISSFEWVGNPLEAVGLRNPVQAILDKLEGDWPRLGLAIDAVSQLTAYWREMSEDVGKVRDNLAAGWSGVAADATLAWFDTLQEACSDHASSLSGFQNRVRTEALAMKTAVGLLVGLVEDVASLVPDLEGSIGDKVVGLLGSVARGLGKFIDTIDKAFLALEATITAGFALISVFAQLRGGDGEFHTVAQPLALDVNG